MAVYIITADIDQSIASLSEGVKLFPHARMESGEELDS